MKKKKKTIMAGSEPVAGFKDVQVETTNSESLLSKLSLVPLGYRNDPFLKVMCSSVPNKFRRSPAINRGYLTRLVAIENSFEKFILLQTSENKGEKFQVLSLGAGYDTAFFRLRNCGIINSESCNYFEVDFPVVATTKCRKICQNRILRSFFTRCECFDLESCYKFDEGRLCLVGCNMTDTSSLEQKLNLLGFDWNCLTIILTECSTTYVDTKSANILLKWITDKIANFIFVDYEQIRPFDVFGQIMKRHFANRGSPLKCIDTYPTVNDHLNRFKSLNWPICFVQTISQIVQTFFGSSEMNRIQHCVQDLFDEEEELHLKCSHYILVVAAKFETLKNQICHFRSDLEDEVKFQETLPTITLHSPDNDNVSGRFGQSMACNDDKLFFIGGYSKLKQRDNQLIIVGRSNCWPVERCFTFPSDKTLFSSFVLTSNSFAFVFGGRASPQDPSDKLFQVDLQTGFAEEILVESKPAARWKHTLTAVSDHHLILVGGKNRSQVFSDVYLYDTTEHRWDLKQKLDRGLFSHSAVFHNGKVILSGGLDESGRINENFYIYDWRDNNVTSFKIEGVINRFSHTSHVLSGDRILLVGGVSTSQEPGIAIIDLTTRTCKEYAIGSGHQLEAPMTLHTSYIEEEESGKINIFIFGGGTNCFSFGMHLNSKVVQLQLLDK